MGLTLSIITFLGILYLITNRKKTKDEIKIDKKYNNIVEKQKDIKIFNSLEHEKSDFINPKSGLPMMTVDSDIAGNSYW
jgi:hypothetical protein